MQIQRVQYSCYKPQFNGTLTLIKTGWDIECVKIAQKQISKKDDKELYDKFVKILGEKPKAHASITGTTPVESNVFNSFYSKINKLLNTKISNANDRKSFMYSYSTNGEGGLTYQIGTLEDSYVVEHKLQCNNL